jgi:hypothetical protein
MSRTDFDFLPGTWSVRHERLTNRFDPGCTEWEQFDSVTDARAILGGLGNTDETTGRLPDGTTFDGYSLRLYSPETDEWAIWWAASSRPGLLDDPVRGRFENGVGTFIGPGEYDGVEFLARFQWLDTDTPNPVWQQDFSFDGGASWAAVNWRMHHIRR